MRFRRQDDDREGQFELISMTDIVFLLLIFFMISSTFVELDSHLDIQLPETAGGALAEATRSYVYREWVCKTCCCLTGHRLCWKSWQQN